MKKILVLGALSLFCLTDVETMHGAAAGPQAQDTIRVVKHKFEVLVKENENDEWKTISSTKLKPGMFHSISLKNLNREEVIAALTAISYGEPIPTNTTPTDAKLTSEEKFLLSLTSMKLKELKIVGGAIDDKVISIMIRVLENNPSLQRVGIISFKNNVTPKLLLNLWEALIKLPILESSDIYCGCNAGKIVDAMFSDKLISLNVTRGMMLDKLERYIATNHEYEITSYGKSKEEVKQLTAELNRSIAAARERLPQE